MVHVGRDLVTPTLIFFYFAAVLRQAAIALQLSLREGFEVKVTEAILKGVPVIATRVGGIPLQVIDGETGFLVDSGANQAGKASDPAILHIVSTVS